MQETPQYAVQSEMTGTIQCIDGLPVQAKTNSDKGKSNPANAAQMSLASGGALPLGDLRAILVYTCCWWKLEKKPRRPPTKTVLSDVSMSLGLQMFVSDVETYT